MDMPDSTMAQFQNGSHEPKFDEKKAYVAQEKEGETFVSNPMLLRQDLV